MQESSLYSLAGISASIPRQPRALAGSRSLASMLPTILTTGLVSLLATAVMRMLWMGWSHDFMGAWMEAWLTVWPIAFPVAYISKPVINRLTRYLSKPVHGKQGEARLGVSAVMQASEQATANSGLRRKPHLLPVHR